jgi:hypothetical protein
MFYIIQENTFREANYNNLIIALERLELQYEIVKVRPFIDTIEFNTKEKNVFIFGSLKLARIGKNYWNPGSLSNKNHDYEIYKNYYKDNLLNYDSTIVNFHENFDIYEPKFIRPTLDNKLFTGKVFDRYDWEKQKETIIKNENSLSYNTKIQISTPKKIFNESRFWIVDNKISTFSTYRNSGVVVYRKDLVDSDAIKFCELMINKFQLAKAFVMDIANTENGYKIVECGCINSAGFYDADLQKLLFDLENAFN